MPLDVGKLRAQIDLDIDGFKSDIGKAGSEFQGLGRKAEGANKQIEDGAKKAVSAAGKSYSELKSEVDKYSQAAQKAASDVTDAQQRQKLVADRLTQAQAEFGRESRQAIQFAKQLADAQKDVEKATENAWKASDQYAIKQKQMAQQAASGFADTAKQAGSSGQDAAANFIEGFSPRLASLGGKGGPIGLALAGGAVLGIAAGKLLADNVMQGFEIQAQRGQTKATFGFTDAQMAEVGKAAGGAYGNAWGESVNENMRAAGLAMQSGLLDGNATAAQIQPVVEQLDIVSKIMGTDIQETARAAGQAVKTGLADNATEALDLMTAAQQKGLNISGDLLDTFVEYGTQFRKVGIDGPTAMGLVAQAMKGGARDTDIAADAIKEFSIRVIDGSKSTQGAFQALGLDVGATEQAFARGGESARKMADDVIERLGNIDDGVERNAIGVALFGTQWEDMGAAIDRMDLDTAAKELGNIGGAAKRAGDDMSGGAASIEAVKNRISMAADNMKVKLAEAFAPAAGDAANWITDHATEIENFFISAAKAGAQFGGAMLEAGGYLMGFGAQVMRVGSFIAEGLITPVGQVLKTLGGLASRLPGALGENGRAMQAAGEQAMSFGGRMRSTADAMSKGAEMMGIAGQKALELANQIQTIPEGKAINVTDPGGQGVLDRLREMGAKVSTDNNKNIVVEAPLAPNVLQQLRDIGVEVVNRNGKQIIVKANDDDYRTKKDEWTKTEYKDLIVRSYQQGQNPFAPGAGITAGPPSANGGPISGPGGPKDDRILTPLSNGEFVQQAAAVDYYGPGFMHAINNRQIPRELIAPGFAAGGLIDVAALKNYMQGIDSGTYSFGGWGNGWNTDCSGGQSIAMNGMHGNGTPGTGQRAGTAAFDAFTAAMGLQPGTAPAGIPAYEVGWSPEHTAGTIFDPQGGDVNVEMGGSYGNGKYGGSTGSRDGQFPARAWIALPGGVPAGQPAVAAGVPIVPLTQRPDGTWTSPSPEWAHLIDRESGGDPDIVQQIQDANSGGNEASGLFQIAKGTWSGYGGQQYAPTAGQATPEQQAMVAAKIFNAEGGSPWGSGLPGRESDAGLRAGLSTTAPAPTAPQSPGYTGDPGGNANTYGADGDSSSTSNSKPPEDPSVATFEFDNPLEPFWWKGEKEYRDRIISDYEKQKAWDDYWSGKSGADGGTGKDGKAKTKKTKVKSIAEATEDVANAKSALDIARARQREMKPDAKESSKLSAAQSITKAEQALRDAEAALKLAKENPSGYKTEPVQRADGGPISGPGGPRDDQILVAASNGEFVHNADAVDYYGTKFMDDVNQKRFPRFANGGPVGFGGYSDSNPDVMAPNNWYDYLALAGGAGFAAYNMAEPYAQSVISGKWDLGNITPQLNTGTTDTGFITSTLSSVGGQIQQQLAELIWVVKEGKNITVKIDGANSPFATSPGMSVGQVGYSGAGRA